MTNFQFKEEAQKIENLCKESIELLSTRGEKEIKNLVSDFELFLSEHHKQKKLTIGFIGQYSAGKSTIIASLTKAEFVKKYYKEVGDEKKLIDVYRIDSKELKIGVQITTDKTESYIWKEVLLIDTPGIYAGYPEHDKITLDQISKSDLLVFVVSNELFNPQAGKFFKKVTQEMERIGQMVLVINKMTRETGTPDELLKTILQVVEPCHTDDFYTCFIDAQSYLKAQNEKDEDEKKFLINESKFDNFVTNLDKLIKRNHLYARLITPLHRNVDVLEKSLNILTAEDKTSRDFLEILRRKALIIRASKIKFQNSFRAELNKLEHEVILLGEKLASMIDGQHKMEEINVTSKNVESEMHLLSEKTRDKIQSLLKDELTRLQTDLEELQQSPLGRSLAEEFEVAGVGKKTVGGISFGEKGEIPPILKKGPEALAKLGNFTSKVSRDMVYGTVKFFGGNFKPWGAVNAAEFINKLGPILAGLGTILDFFLTFKEEKDKEKYEQVLRDSRAEIRQDFRKAALEMLMDFKNGGQDEKGNKYEGLDKVVFKDIYQQELENVEELQNQFRSIEKSKKITVDKLKQLLHKIKNEISLF